MKLLRYGKPGAEQPGLLDSDGNIRDLSAFVKDISGDALSSETLSRLSTVDQTRLPLVDGRQRIGPCIASPGKFICIGLNYSDHAAETGATIPSEPIVFLKATSAVCGPHDDIQLPLGSNKLDWEVELGMVIGRHTKYVQEDEALERIAGFCVVNDVSERSYQIERQGQWTKGKSFDTFGPIGPWLVTKDEIADPSNLRMWCDVNGERMQDGSTKTMIFKPAFIVAYLSQFMSLQPGDIITTGTPPGVGMGKNPPRYLRVGDTISLSVEGLGVQNQSIISS